MSPVPPPVSTLPRAGFGSALTLSVVSLWCKAFLGLTARRRVTGKEHILQALRNNTKQREMDARAVVAPGAGAGAGAGAGQAFPVVAGGGAEPRTRGLLTICNHNSIVDDPMMWSFLPITHLLPFASPSKVCANARWTLGASDIMFTNSVSKLIFTAGQVIETVRGAGIYQPAVDNAVARLAAGGHVHIFPEGKVNQSKSHPEGGMIRFKWGVGRVIMDAKTMPEIIPIWISGFDQIMNERRGFPRFIPRPGARVSITVGAPITETLRPMIDAHRLRVPRSEGDLERTQSGLMTDPDYDMRVGVTATLQEELAKLGRMVEGEEGRFEKGQWSQSTSFAERGIAVKEA